MANDCSKFKENFEKWKNIAECNDIEYLFIGESWPPKNEKCKNYQDNYIYNDERCEWWSIKRIKYSPLPSLLFLILGISGVCRTDALFKFISERRCFLMDIMFCGKNKSNEIEEFIEKNCVKYVIFVTPKKRNIQGKVDKLKTRLEKILGKNRVIGPYSIWDENSWIELKKELARIGLL